MSITAREILSSAQKALDSHLGDLGTTCKAAHPPEQATATSLVFVSESSGLQQALEKRAPVIVAPLSLKERCQEQNGLCYLFFKDRSFAMSQILPLFEDPELWPPGIHTTAAIADSAKIGADVQIGAYAVIGEGVAIGARCQIAPHAVIERDAVIGEASVIGAHSFIGRKTQIGRHCRIKAHASIATEGYGFAPTGTGNHRIPQLGIVVIEDEVEVGSFTAIDRATLTETRIKRGAKLDNLIHISHNCEIGEHCLITAGFATAGSTKLGSRVVTGGGVLVGDHLTICSNVQIAGGSTVRKDIHEPGQYGGDPIQPMKQFLKTLLSLPELPRIKKELSKLMKD